MANEFHSHAFMSLNQDCTYNYSLYNTTVICHNFSKFSLTYLAIAIFSLERFSFYFSHKKRKKKEPINQHHQQKYFYQTINVLGFVPVCTHVCARVCVGGWVFKGQ